MLIMINVGS
uniref:Uncharacterized protein n=1 Tax=Anguilla anguilla TaxID=7936 RepID=A0A0E9Q6D5_ANGAN